MASSLATDGWNRNVRWKCRASESVSPIGYNSLLSQLTAPDDSHRPLRRLVFLFGLGGQGVSTIRNELPAKKKKNPEASRELSRQDSRRRTMRLIMTTSYVLLGCCCSTMVLAQAQAQAQSGGGKSTLPKLDVKVVQSANQQMQQAGITDICAQSLSRVASTFRKILFFFT